MTSSLYFFKRIPASLRASVLHIASGAVYLKWNSYVLLSGKKSYSGRLWASGKAAASVWYSGPISVVCPGLAFAALSLAIFLSAAQMPLPWTIGRLLDLLCSFMRPSLRALMHLLLIIGLHLFHLTLSWAPSFGNTLVNIFHPRWSLWSFVSLLAPLPQWTVSS